MFGRNILVVELYTWCYIYQPAYTCHAKYIYRAMAKNGSSRSFLGQKRVGRIMKAANTPFGLT